MVRDLTAAFLLICSCATASAATQFFDNEADWLAAVDPGSVERFDFTSANVGLADGVVGPVLDGAELGQQLDWQSANTGMSVDFRFNNSSFQSPSAIHWIDREGGALTSNPQVDHSWTLTLSTPPSFLALGFTVNGAGSFEDGFLILDAHGEAIASFSGGPPRETVFAGYILDTPFATLLYADHANIVGGKPILNFSIANPVPEPGTLVLLLGCLAWPLGRRVAASG